MTNEYLEVEEIRLARDQEIRDAGGILKWTDNRSDIETPAPTHESLSVPAGREPIAEREDEPTTAEVTVEPASNANKGEWIAYRMETHNLSEAEAEGLTKAQLVDLK